MKYNKEFYKRLLLILSEYDTKISGADYAVIAGKLSETGGNPGAIKSLLPRVSRSISGDCCMDDRLKTGSPKSFVYLVRDAYTELYGSEGLGQLSFIRTNGTQGHRKLGKLDNTNDKYDTAQDFTFLKSKERKEQPSVEDSVMGVGYTTYRNDLEDSMEVMSSVEVPTKIVERCVWLVIIFLFALFGVVSCATIN